MIGKDETATEALHPDSLSSGNLQKKTWTLNHNSMSSSKSYTSLNRKDLIGNMNIKGNMDQLKKLMKTMANDVQESNVAIVQRQKDRHEKEMEKLTKDEKKKKAENEKQQ